MQQTKAIYGSFQLVPGSAYGGRIYRSASYALHPFLCNFDIDYSYYEEQTGDQGPERFSFEYDFENGVILNYDYENAELESVKIPYEYEDSFESCWYLSQGENYIEMQGESVNDVGGNQSDKMEQIVETLDQYEFKKLANAVLSKVKDIEGVD